MVKNNPQYQQYIIPLTFLIYYITFVRLPSLTVTHSNSGQQTILKLQYKKAIELSRRRYSEEIKPILPQPYNVCPRSSFLKIWEKGWVLRIFLNETWTGLMSTFLWVDTVTVPQQRRFTSQVPSGDIF